MSQDPSIEARLEALGIRLPAADAARGRYSPFVRSGNQLWLAGQGPTRDGAIAYAGKVGRDLTVEQGRDAARLTMINLLAQARHGCGGDLSHVVRCLAATVYVNCTADFQQHPAVADGATELLAALWGDDLLPARSAVGMCSLPMDIAVEIDAVFEIRAA